MDEPLDACLRRLFRQPRCCLDMYRLEGLAAVLDVEADRIDDAVRLLLQP
jgi:hypothetical protein